MECAPPGFYSSGYSYLIPRFTIRSNQLSTGGRRLTIKLLRCTSHDRSLSIPKERSTEAEEAQRLTSGGAAVNGLITASLQAGDRHSYWVTVNDSILASVSATPHLHTDNAYSAIYS
ncbi:hypothetical protein J6590_050488 [Homalodisca vitripennis]|nr:hypothetical protein J6590_050488 [Homalodisca vitripennis]